MGVVGMVRSPNVRLERATKKQFDQIHGWVVDTLDVGKRSVTIDILAAAMQEVAQAHPDELLEAVREQWVRRAEEAEEGVAEEAEEGVAEEAEEGVKE